MNATSAVVWPCAVRGKYRVALPHSRDSPLAPVAAAPERGTCQLSADQVESRELVRTGRVGAISTDVGLAAIGAHALGPVAAPAHSI